MFYHLLTHMIVYGFSFFIFLSPASAGEVIITGFFPRAAGEEVRLIRFADFLSQVEVIADVGRIDANGNFSLRMICSSPQPVWVDVAFYRDRLLVVPGGRYHLTADAFLVTENGNPLIPRSVIGAEVSRQAPDALDSLLVGLENEIQGFLDTFSFQVYVNRQENLLDSFALRCYRKYASYGNPYLVRAAACGLVSLYPNARLPFQVESFSALTADTTHYFYMDWLEDYLGKRLLHASPGAPSGLKRSLIATVNRSGSYQSLQDTLSLHLQIVDPVFSGLTTLMAIKTMYPAPLFPTSQLLLFLRQMDSAALRNPGLTMAGRLLTKYTALERGSRLPDTEFITTAGDTLRFSGFRGKPLYVVFARPGCMSCLTGLETLRVLKERFGDRVHFLALFTSHDSVRSAQLIYTAGYPWPSAIIGRNYPLMYQLKSFGLPLEMLVGADGKILAYPAYRPEEGLESVLLKLTGHRPANVPRFNPPRRRN